MKLKTVEFKRTETETEIEFPVYLYFQDENCDDEFQKIEADKETILKRTWNGYEITVRQSDGCIGPSYLKNKTTKEHYDEFHADLIEYIKEI